MFTTTHLHFTILSILLSILDLTNDDQKNVQGYIILKNMVILWAWAVHILSFYIKTLPILTAKHRKLKSMYYTNYYYYFLVIIIFFFLNLQVYHGIGVIRDLFAAWLIWSSIVFKYKLTLHNLRPNRILINF